MGLVRTKIGSGTYVSEAVGEAAVQPVPWHQLLVPHPQNPLSGIIRDLVSIDLTNEIISLATGLPDPALYPETAFLELLTRPGTKMNSADMGHIPTEGYLPLRLALASFHNNKGVAGTARNIAVVSGSQQGLYLLTKIFINPGDYVIAEAPTYLGAIPVFQAAGARILSLPAPGRLDLGLLEDYLIRYRPKVLYMMPSFQNPSGRVLNLGERQALLALAARHRLIIIEDDPYGELYYDGKPPAALKTLDHFGGVIYIGTFSKILFPGLRIGWIWAAEPVINRLALEKQYVDLHSANLSQWQLSEFMAGGNLAGHLETIRREYKKRRDTMANALERHCGDQLSYSVPTGGFYFWCRMTHPTATAQQLLQEATRQGVTFVPGEAFYSDTEGSTQFRLCFATNNEETLQEGIKRLGKALAQVSKSYKPGGRSSLSTTKPLI